MRRTKFIVTTLLLAAMTFGTAVSGIGSEDANQTASYGEFDPGSTDQMILNGGTIAQDGEVTYYSDEEGLHRASGENDQLVSNDIAENINVSDNALYYSVTEGGASQIRVLDLGSREESEILALDGGIDQMYLVNSQNICYSSEGTVYQLDLETGVSGQIETPGEVFSFLPTEYGVVTAVGELFDIDIYAGDTLISENAASYYTDEGYILIEADGQQYQIGLEEAFNGSGSLEEVSIYETVFLSDIFCEDEECEVCEDNYEALLDGEVSLYSYKVQDVGDGYTKTLSDGQKNVVLRARQQAEIKWTPLTTVKGWKGEYTFEAGKTYYGIPYGQPVNQGYYTPYNATFSAFASAIKNSSSEFYTSYSSYGSKTSTYYASDCSAFVSWAWGLSGRQTTHTLNSRGTVMTGWTTYSIQVGDILNLSGSHAVLVSDVQYDSNGAVSSVEIMEQTPPIIKTTRYGGGGSQTLATLTSKYSGYALVRYNNIDSVVYTYDANVPITDPSYVGPTRTFADVTSNDWYYEAVEYVYAYGLFNGTSASTFSPNASMTRGQLVTVLGRMSEVNGDTYSYAGTINASGINFRSGPGTSYSSIDKFNIGDKVTVLESGTWCKVEFNGTTGYVKNDYLVGTFSDVSTGQYYVGYIEWAVKAGIVQGYNSTQFGPDDSLTREQMCTILCRYASFCDIILEKTVEEVTFTDASSISNYSREYVKTLQMTGIINGMGDGRFAPQNTCVRAQVATMLMRYYENYVLEDDVIEEDVIEREVLGLAN